MPNVAEATPFHKQPPRSAGTSGHSVADAIRERRIEDPERLLMQADRNPGRSWSASPVAGHRRRRGSYSRSDRQPSACRMAPANEGVRRCSHSWDHAWSRRRRPGGARGTRRRSRRVADERIGPEISIGDDLGWWSVALIRDTRHRSRNRDALNSNAGRFGDAGLSARRDFKSPGYDAISRGATHHQDPPWSGTADSRFPRSAFRSKRRVPDDLERAMNLRRKNGQ